MKTVAMESFRLLEVILCRMVALPIRLIAFLGFILGGEDPSLTVQAYSSYLCFSGYFICDISMLLPAGVRGEPKPAS